MLRSVEAESSIKQCISCDGYGFVRYFGRNRMVPCIHCDMTGWETPTEYDRRDATNDQRAGDAMAL